MSSKYLVHNSVNPNCLICSQQKPVENLCAADSRHQACSDCFFKILGGRAECPFCRTVVQVDPKAVSHLKNSRASSTSGVGMNPHTAVQSVKQQLQLDEQLHKEEESQQISDMNRARLQHLFTQNHPQRHKLELLASLNERQEIEEARIRQMERLPGESLGAWERRKVEASMAAFEKRRKLLWQIATLPEPSPSMGSLNKQRQDQHPPTPRKRDKSCTIL